MTGKLKDFVQSEAIQLYKKYMDFLFCLQIFLHIMYDDVVISGIH